MIILPDADLDAAANNGEPALSFELLSSQADVVDGNAQFCSIPR